MEIKSGIKTTEFFISWFAPVLVTGLVAFGIVEQGQSTEITEIVTGILIAIAAIVASVSQLSYNNGRIKVKVEAIKKASPEIVG